VGFSQLCFAPPSRAAEMGVKLCSSLPVLQVSKPFQSYYRRAKELRKGHSVKWNDVLLEDSLVDLKMYVGFDKKDSGAKPQEKKAAKPQPPVKQGLFKKGFFNPRSTASITPISPREVIDVRVVGSSSPSRDCIILSSVEENGFSQSRAWPIGLITMGRLWSGRRTLIFGMDCPWIGRWMMILGRRPWLSGMPWKKIFCETR
jgi:hypothetical protein